LFLDSAQILSVTIRRIREKPSANDGTTAPLSQLTLQKTKGLGKCPMRKNEHCKNTEYKNDEYRANAAECERMARVTRNESEKRTWHEMAESWLRLIRTSDVSRSFEAMDIHRSAQALARSER
jgi:hypothetical protein